jgi:DnaJ-class molecular chaperone
MTTGIWQTCPKCQGEGTLMELHINRYNISGKCDVCDGRKIISQITGLPPKIFTETDYSPQEAEG